LYNEIIFSFFNKKVFPRSPNYSSKMKRNTLLGCLFLLFSNHLRAQDYTPIDFSAQSVWYIEAVDIDPVTNLPQYFHHIFSQFDGDTVLGNKNYHKYYYQIRSVFNPVNLEFAYLGGIREDGRQVYFIHRDSSAEILLYDFDHMAVGDTLLWWHCSSDPSVFCDVKQISTVVLLDGSTRKRYRYDVTTINPPMPATYREIVEGIGSTYGLVPAFQYQQNNVYDGGAYLRRYCKNHVELYGSLGSQLPPEDNPCYTFVGLMDVPGQLHGVELMPNPFEEHLMLQASEGGGEYRVYVQDVLGKTVSEQTLTLAGAPQTLEIPALPPGLYILSVWQEGKRAVFRVVRQ
jgi:hypothetical protein